MGGMDRILAHPTIRHFLLGFEEKECAVALECAAVLGICAMSDRYGRGVRLAHISCLQSLAKSVERKGKWPTSLVELRGIEVEDVVDGSFDDLRSGRKKTKAGRGASAGRSVPPRSRSSTKVRQAQGDLLRSPASASSLLGASKQLRRRRSAPPAPFAELVGSGARPGSKRDTGSAPSRGMQAAVTSGRPGVAHFLQRQMEREPDSMPLGLKAALAASGASRGELRRGSRSRSRSASAERRTVRVPTARPLVPRTTAGALTDTEAPLIQSADEATAEWYSRLMMRLKRLDSQKGKDGMRVMGDSAYIGASPQAEPAAASGGSLPVSSRTTTTGGLRDSMHSDRGAGLEGYSARSGAALEPTPPVSARQRRGVSYTDVGGNLFRRSGDSSGSSAHAATGEPSGVAVLQARLEALTQECAASEALLETTTASFGQRPASEHHISARIPSAPLQEPIAALGKENRGSRAALNHVKDSAFPVMNLPSRQERRDRRVGVLDGRPWDTDEDFLDQTQEALGVSILE